MTIDYTYVSFKEASSKIYIFDNTKYGFNLFPSQNLIITTHTKFTKQHSDVEIKAKKIKDESHDIYYSVGV